jgi:CheY-specific phosphatase CheX
MSNKYNDIIIRAVKDIFKEVSLQIYKIEIADSIDENEEIIANIGITGNFKGSFLLSSNLKSAKNITGHLLSNSSIEHIENKFGEIDKAAFSELANQLSARIVMYFSENDIDCSITPPTIITGIQIKSLIYGLTDYFYSNIIGPFGYIYLLFGIK